eukprot:scaffold15422_cov107-Isochrysis_galbana.AAC.9
MFRRAWSRARRLTLLFFFPAQVEDELDDAQETVGMAAMRQSRAAVAAAAAAQKAAVAEDASVYDYDGAA